MTTLTLDQAFDAGLLIDEAGRPIVSRKQLADAKWITVHPNGAGTKGTPVQISENGTVLAGMGGKFNGKKLGELKGGSTTQLKMMSESSVNISGGSEKQNKWATDIARKWVGTLNSEMKNIEQRLKDDHSMNDYAQRLNEQSEKMSKALSEISSKQVIDLHQSGRDMGRMMVQRAMSK